MAISHRLSTSVFQTGTAARTVTPDAATAVGELMVLPVGFQDSSATTISTPTGWTARKSAVQTGTLKTSIFSRTKQAGDESFTYAPSQAVETAHLALSIAGCDPASLVVGADGTRAASGGATATTAPSITTTVPGTRVYVIAIERTTANETVEATVNNGFTKILHTFQNGTSAESIFIGYKDIPTPGAVGATTVTFQNAQASNGYAVLIAVAPAAMTARRGFNTVAEMREKRGATWAHRGGSASYVEHSLFAYEKAAERGYGALELSMQRTSDGVWFGCHDIDLARVTGGAAPATDVRTMTWAQVNAYQMTVGATGAPQPFMRWQDFLAAGYGSTHVLILDPKNSVGTHQAEFLAMVAGDVAKDRVLMKWSGGLTSFADAARAAGFQTAGYWYQADYDAGRLPAETEHWDWLGMDLNAGTAWTGPGNIVELAAAQGKKIWGHIAGSQADYNTAMAKGADVVQSAGVAVIRPVSWWTSDPVLPALTASGMGTRTVPGANGTGNTVLPALAGAGAGTSTVPVSTGAGSAVLPGLSAAGAGTRTVPVFSGAGEATLPPLQAVGLGTSVPPVFVATGALALPGLAASGAGIVVNPTGVAGIGALALPPLTASGEGTRTIPTSTGTGALMLPMLVAAGTAVGERVGVGALALAAMTASGAGTFAGVDPPPAPYVPNPYESRSWRSRAPGAERPYNPRY